MDNRRRAGSEPPYQPPSTRQRVDAPALPAVQLPAAARAARVGLRPLFAADRPLPRAPATHDADVGGLSNLPGSTLDSVARFLPTRDMASLSATSRALREEVSPALHRLAEQSAAVADRAAHVHDLQGFLGVLGTTPTARAGGTYAVVDLPAELRSRPLSVLLERFAHMPVEDRHAAANAFRATVAALDAEHQTPALQVFDRIAAHGPIQFAIVAGENALLVHALHGASPEHTALEGLVAHHPAREALLRGQNVQAIAQHYGVETQEGRHHLEMVAINGDDIDGIEYERGTRWGFQAGGPAGQAVLRGENIRAIAAQYGIETQPGLMDLEMVAYFNRAGTDVRHGANPLTVAQRYGIASETVIFRLMRLADLPEREQEAALYFRADGSSQSGSASEASSDSR